MWAINALYWLSVLLLHIPIGGIAPLPFFTLQASASISFAIPIELKMPQDCWYVVSTFKRVGIKTGRCNQCDFSHVTILHKELSKNARRSVILL
ncbi:MAG: hypothetical protein ACJAZ6_002390 [Oleispira sp.]|jgi:hypothetical protein